MATNLTPIADAQAALAHLKQDKNLSRCLNPELVCPLFQLPRTTDLFTELSRAIIAQQLTPKAAATIYQRYLDLFSEQPHPEQLLRLSPAALRSPGLSKQKATYLLDLAEKISANTIPDITQLAEYDDEAVIQHLIQVKGVGQWTAQMLLIFRLQRLDVLPVDDLGIRKKMQQLYGLGDRPKPAQMLEIAEPWRPYRSVACWYLWQWTGV